MVERVPRHYLAAGALYVLSWAMLAAVGHSLGVAAGEGGAISASIDAALALGGLVGAAPALGPAEVGTTPAGQPALTAALGLLLLGRLVDGLTALRLGLAALTALAPPGVFLLARGTLGPSTAMLAGLLTLFHPRWLLGASALHGEGALAAGAVATLWAYGLFLERPGRGPAALLGLSFGLALTASPAALVLPAATFLQGVWPSITPPSLDDDDPKPRRAYALVAMAAGGALCFGLSSLVQLALGLPPLPWAPAPDASSGPSLSTARAFALPWVSAPATTAVFALAGLATFAWLARRHPPQSRPLVAAAVVGAFLAARPLLWPGQHGLADDGALAPFVGLFAALGVRAVALALAPAPSPRAPSLHALAFAVALAGPWWASLSAPATLSASFSTLAGGARRVARTGALPLHDGSPLGGLAGAIDGLGRAELAAHAPGIADDAWPLLRRLGRLRTRVRPVADPAQADVEVRTGADAPPGGAALFRDGQAIVSLGAPSGPRPAVADGPAAPSP